MCRAATEPLMKLLKIQGDYYNNSRKHRLQSLFAVTHDWISLHTSTASSCEPDPLLIFLQSFRKYAKSICCLASPNVTNVSLSSDNNASTPEVTVSFSLRFSFRCSRSGGEKNGSPGSSKSRMSSHSVDVKNRGSIAVFLFSFITVVFGERNFFLHASPILLKDRFTSLQRTAFLVRNTCRG
jgi:hypothetical protein